MYEIEFRAKLSESKYNSLLEFLNINGKNLGQDDKDVWYYIFPDKLLKLVNNISKKTAKVSLKLNRIGEGSAFEEMEFYFPPEEFETCHQLFQKLNLDAKVMDGPQRRVNFEYKGCEIALKYSDVWKYHLEIEQMVESQNVQEQAERSIRSVAEELGVELMSEEELKAFVTEVENKL